MASGTAVTTGHPLKSGEIKFCDHLVHVLPDLLHLRREVLPIEVNCSPLIARSIAPAIGKQVSEGIQAMKLAAVIVFLFLRAVHCLASINAIDLTCTLFPSAPNVLVSVVLSIDNRPVQGLLCLVRVGVVGLVDIDEEPLLPVIQKVQDSSGCSIGIVDEVMACDFEKQICLKQDELLGQWKHCGRPLIGGRLGFGLPKFAVLDFVGHLGKIMLDHDVVGEEKPCLIVGGFVCFSFHSTKHGRHPLQLVHHRLKFDLGIANCFYHLRVFNGNAYIFHDFFVHLGHGRLIRIFRKENATDEAESHSCHSSKHRVHHAQNSGGQANSNLGNVLEAWRLASLDP